MYTNIVSAPHRVVDLDVCNWRLGSNKILGEDFVVNNLGVVNFLTFLAKVCFTNYVEYVKV